MISIKNKNILWGGMGSSDWIRLGNKSTVDSQHAVDIRYLKKQGALWGGNNGSLTWSQQGLRLIVCNPDVTCICLKVALNQKGLRQNSG